MSPEQRRRDMVERQLRRRGIRDERVLEAMARVPRELFLPETRRHLAYEDGAQSIGEGQTISQPFMVARTCELAALTGVESVLEVGAGSGYQAAVLVELAARVVAVERIPALVAHARAALAAAGYGDRVRVEHADGSVGWPPAAPYDRIVVAAAAPEIPGPLVEQLVVGGRLIVPVGPRHHQELLTVDRTADGMTTRAHEACVYVPLIGAAAWPE